MRRLTLFCSRFLLGLWIVLAATFLWLLIPNAPDVPDNGPFAGVSIQTEQNVPLHLPNRSFRCTETDQEFQCLISIQDQLLTLNLTKGQGYPYDLSNCRATYGGQTVGCREAGQNYAPTLAKMYEVTNMNLSSQQIQSVRQTYWGINSLMQLGEIRLTWISAGLAITAGIIAALFTWFHPEFWSKGFVSFACGFGVYQLVERFLGRVPFDVVTPYGLTPDDWVGVVRGGAIAAGIAAMLITALLLWRRVNHFSRVLISLVIGAGIFSLAWWALSWNVGYTLALFEWANQLILQHRRIVSLFFTAISGLVAIAAVILIWTYTNSSIRKFLCLGSGFGAVTLASHLFMYLLLDLGYMD